MRLLLVRHAEAGDPDPSRYPDDRRRPLTPVGERDHARVASTLARLNLGVATVLTSPLTRARQTADITARALGVGDVRVVEALGDPFSVDTLLDELRACPSQATIACVGHEPSLPDFAALLLDGRGGLRLRFAKSAVMAVECQGHPAPGGARLLFFVSPREIAASGAGTGPGASPR